MREIQPKTGQSYQEKYQQALFGAQHFRATPLNEAPENEREHRVIVDQLVSANSSAEPNIRFILKAELTPSGPILGAPGGAISVETIPSPNQFGKIPAGYHRTLLVFRPIGSDLNVEESVAGPDAVKRSFRVNGQTQTIENLREGSCDIADPVLDDSADQLKRDLGVIGWNLCNFQTTMGKPTFE